MQKSEKTPSKSIQRVAEFEKVSKTRFLEDAKTAYELGYTEQEAADIYEYGVKLPERATKGSAGYDFRAPFGFVLDPGETITIPTGIRCRIDDGWVLTIYPRSGLGFKYREMLSNTVGVVDADYYGSDNEGHIFLKIVNASTEHKKLVVHAGDAFAQGIFLPFGITVSDDVQAVRNGGMGSTDANRK